MPRASNPLQQRHHIAVLGVDQRHGAELGAARERAQQHLVVDHQGALVGHEMLEGVDAVGLHRFPSRREPAGSMT
jgi:hypothetical protein